MLSMLRNDPQQLGQNQQFAQRRRTSNIVVLLAIVLFASVLACASEVDGQPLTPEAQLEAMGIELPQPGTPVANYVRAVTTGNLVFLAGHIPRNDDGIVVGKLGDTFTIEQGYAAAKLSAIASQKRGARFTGTSRRISSGAVTTDSPVTMP